MAKKVEELTVMLKATRRGMTEISHDGETYKVDKEGFVEVPVSIVDTVLSHGFREATDEDIKAPRGK